MNFRSKTSFSKDILKKSLIAFPPLFFLFLIYGINREHRDYNAGSMYPLVFAIHYIGLTVMSYILYFVTDRLTYNTKFNPIKNFVHLILGFCLFFNSNQVLMMLLSLTLPMILAINLITELYCWLKKSALL
jgi:hypothetical protein